MDSHTHLLAFIRMDGAKITSINIALDKAFTAAGHRVPTSAYKENVWPGGMAFGIGNTNGGRFCTIGGGVPIIDDEGRVLGAVGCSTGTPAQDEEVANAGRDAVLGLVRKEKEKEKWMEVMDAMEKEKMIEEAMENKRERERKRPRKEITPPADPLVEKMM